MGLLDRLKGATTKRSADYAAGALNRLTAGMASYSLSANQEIYRSLRTIRARSRELARDNAHAKKFLQMVENNVIGPDGIMLQNRAADYVNGQAVLDKVANSQIERAFRDWSKRGTAEITGKMSFPALQRLIIRTMARDGEVLVRRVRGSGVNAYGYTLQMIDVDRLDEMHNEVLPSGNRVLMGVEINDAGRPVAYHILRRHPGDLNGLTGQSTAPQQRERVLAEDIFHDFICDRPEQTRGMPWMHAAMIRLNQLGAFEEAAIIAARIGAAKMGFFTGGDAEDYADDTESDGTYVSDAEPGTFEVLPAGREFQAFDPKYPEANFDPFVKACLRGVASGFGVSYNSLASDLEGVSYSSIRQGVLDERDAWKTIQSHLCDGLMEVVFSDWLPIALLKGAIGNLPPSKLSKFKAATWQPRRWQWVDPKNDMEAAQAAVAMGVKSRTQIAAEQGDDIDDVFNEIEQEEKRMREIGILRTDTPAPVAPQD